MVGSGVSAVDIDNQSGGNYVYNLDGQLIEDAAENINNIFWYPNGKIRRVTYSTQHSDLLFYYDAMGNRVAKIEMTKDAPGSFLPNQYWPATFYVRDAQGQVMATYERSYEEEEDMHYFSLVEQPIYGSSRLGMRTEPIEIYSETPDDPASEVLDDEEYQFFQRSLSQKEYELTDHLGNVQVTVNDMKNGSPGAYTSPMTTATDYYPFGMPMPGRFIASNKYRYGFNGKERDDEVKRLGNSYDFGARIYDPRLGRWFSVDPLAAKFPFSSPYIYADDNPIYYIIAVR